MVVVVVEVEGPRSLDVVEVNMAEVTEVKSSGDIEKHGHGYELESARQTYDAWNVSVEV